jgi:hypothetical protein
MKMKKRLHFFNFGRREERTVSLVGDGIMCAAARLGKRGTDSFEFKLQYVSIHRVFEPFVERIVRKQGLRIEVIQVDIHGSGIGPCRRTFPSLFRVPNASKLLSYLPISTR